VGKGTAKHKGDYQGKHVRLYEWMLKSAAYRSLCPLSRALLIELGRLYNGENNGDFFLSVRRAGRLLNVSKSTAAEAFGDLENRGFIRPKQRGDFNWKSGQATSWILTEDPYANQIATRDFMRWQPAPENQNPVHQAGPSVPPGGQSERKTKETFTKRPAGRTDLVELTAKASAVPDTGSLPCRGAEECGEPRAPEGLRSAATAPLALSDIVPAIVATAKRNRPLSTGNTDDAANFDSNTRRRARG
jgi:hypothetical protein